MEEQEKGKSSMSQFVYLGSCSHSAKATEQPPVYVERSSDDGSELKHPNARRILTKIDLRLLPILSLTYLVAFLDRVNIGNAAVFGAQKNI
jgi:hypothetical protein